uniref:Uncharacterized protein isoform X2 n=1 Tax=Nicotiana tabacum TaxID=4097 RepID=A0A1S3ZWL3_TOBAC|nr:uncharacterized protein LOC104101953 isoform X2 [Nicotiana tomentosiformis]XP_016468733.1 PREDICTED: uncharacterized protein LOC107791225 isoform X2 [Nicotiana tabacum]
MLARITGIHVNGVKNLHIFSIYTFRFLHANTTTTPTHFLVDFLVDSLGFSREEAVTTSNKVPSVDQRSFSWRNERQFAISGGSATTQPAVNHTHRGM